MLKLVRVVSKGGMKHIFLMLKREMVLIETVLLSTHYRVLGDADFSILGDKNEVGTDFSDN